MYDTGSLYGTESTHVSKGKGISFVLVSTRRCMYLTFSEFIKCNEITKQKQKQTIDTISIASKQGRWS